MNYFFGFLVSLSEKIEWKFSVNHIFLVLFVLSIILGLYYGLHAKTEKGQRSTMFALAAILFILEIGRILYKLFYHLSLDGGTLANFNWWWYISFQMCAIMTWTSIVTLLISAFTKKNNYALNFLYNILLGVSLVGASLSFIYPDMIDGFKPLMHFVNIQTILTHTLLIFVPIYLIKIKRLTVSIKNIWKPILGWFWGICIAMTASMISGQTFAYALDCNLMESIGINIPFPFHLTVLAPIMLFLTTLVYSICALFTKKKNINEVKPVIKNIKYYKTAKLFIALTFIVGLGLLFGIALFLTAPTLLGLLFLIPLFASITLLVIGLKYYKKATN